MSEAYFKLVDTDWNLEGVQGGLEFPTICNTKYFTILWIHNFEITILSETCLQVFRRLLHPEKAKGKSLALLSPPSPIHPLLYSEFGTRRRRSFQAQDLVMRGLIEGHEEWKARGGEIGGLSGTSNVSFADN